MNEVLVQSPSSALRYVISLAARDGWPDALRRVQGASEGGVSEQLSAIDRYRNGQSEPEVSAELQIVARFLKGAVSAADLKPGFRALLMLQKEAAELSARVRAGLPGELYYSGILLVIALLIVVLWLVNMAPEFVRFFADFGSELPWLSGLVADNPMIVIVPLAIMACLLLAVTLSTRCLATAIGRLHGELPVWNRWLLGRSIHNAQRDWLALSLASAWAESGVSPELALEQAKAAGMSDRFDTPLGEARSLGILNDELKFQANEALAQLTTAVATHRAFVARIMQVLIASVVGAIIVMMYLPILQLGVVI